MSTQSNNTSSASGGIGFFGLLTVLFVGLKLTHVINWSWWWVLAPMWGSDPAGDFRDLRWQCRPSMTRPPVALEEPK